MTVDVCQPAAPAELQPWVPWLLWGGLTVLVVAVLVLVSLAVTHWLDLHRARRARGAHHRSPIPDPHTSRGRPGGSGSADWDP